MAGQRLAGLAVCTFLTLGLAGCISTSSQGGKPTLEAYADTIVIGTTTRSQMEEILGPAAKMVPQRGGELLVWETRSAEERSIFGSSTPEDRRIIEGSQYGYRHTAVRIVTLNALFDDNGILRKKQLLAP